MRGKPTIKSVWICPICGILERNEWKEVVDEEILYSDIDDAADFAVNEVCKKCGSSVDLYDMIWNEKMKKYRIRIGIGILECG